MKITEKTLNVGQFQWFYRLAESPQSTASAPIILLHGLPAQSLCWTGVMTRLADAGYTAIAPDWLGSGFSDKPERREFPYTQAAYEQALGEWIQALGLEKFSLVVQGYLATVGIQYALNHPEQIERLAILNTPLLPPVKLPWAMRQWTLPLIGDMVTQDPLLVDRTLEGGSGFVISDEALDIYRRPFLKTSASGRALMAATKNLDLAATLPTIGDRLRNEWQHPTQIIWGALDPWLTLDSIKPWVADQDNITLVTLPEAKHYPQIHFPQEVGSALIRFLSAQR